MEAPIPGMTAKPKGDSLMIDAWASFMVFGLSQPDFISKFKHDTGHDLTLLLNRSPMHKLVDDSVGLDQKMMAAWCDWLTENFWGIE